MADKRTNFWVALLNLDTDTNTRVRLWNGYLHWKLPDTVKIDRHQEGWPKIIVNPPKGGWPELTGEEKEKIEVLARNHGGHPEFKYSEPFAKFVVGHDNLLANVMFRS